jgi:hypothetical protein
MLFLFQELQVTPSFKNKKKEAVGGQPLFLLTNDNRRPVLKKLFLLIVF